MDSFWLQYSDYIVGIPAIVLAIVAIWISLKQSRSKKLTYKIITKENLLSYSKEAQGKIEIFFDKNKIDALSLLVIEIQNAGSLPILKSDFDENLKIDFSSTILNNEVIQKEPKSLDIKTEVNENKSIIEFFPFLFNPKDKFLIKFLLNTENPNFSLDCRIIGLKKIEDANKRVKTVGFATGIFVSIILTFFLFYIAVMAIYSYFFPGEGYEKTNPLGVTIIGLLFGGMGFVFLIAIIKEIKQRNI